MDYRVTRYQEKYQSEVVDLILSIQQKEFHVPITLQDQPDLQHIRAIYQKGNGNFWVAIADNKVIGTIAALDFGDNQVALRKMFVHLDHRGKDKAVGQQLLDALKASCRMSNVREIYLGTLHTMHAAHRFYEKNGFVEIAKESLPAKFPLVHVDNKFYQCRL